MVTVTTGIYRIATIERQAQLAVQQHRSAAAACPFPEGSTAAHVFHHAFEQAANLPIPTQIMPCRPGDIAEYFADASLAYRLLGWRTNRSLIQMCEDAWRWQQQNPQGYQ